MQYFLICVPSTVLKNEFFSHLEVQNVLKIHAKILPLNIFLKNFFSPKIRLKILKKFKIFILPLAGVRQYHKIIQKSRLDPQGWLCAETENGVLN